ncbi:hypothetical protein Tco_0889164 [Tanacetum coccineum]
MEYMRTQEVDQKINKTVKEAVTTSFQYAMRAPLRARFKDLPTSDMKEILLQRMLEENYDMGHEDHKMAYEALQKSILRDESEQFDAEKAEKLKKIKRNTTGVSDSTQDPLPPPSSPTTNQDAFMHEESDVEAQDLMFDDEDIGSRHIPKVNLNQEWFKPISAKERPMTPEPACYVPLLENSLLSQTSDIGGLLIGSARSKESQRLLKHNVSRPLLLGGPPGQVTIQTEFFFNKDLEYLRFGSKGDRLALSITR